MAKRAEDSEVCTLKTMQSSPSSGAYDLEIPWKHSLLGLVGVTRRDTTVKAPLDNGTSNGASVTGEAFEKHHVRPFEGPSKHAIFTRQARVNYASKGRHELA